jgi:cbb3-type cytochrome oxidase maturation protein
MNFVMYLLLAAGLVVFGGTTVAAFYWAARNGQFRNLEEGSLTIFDLDEPVGTATDAFTDKSGNGPLRRGVPLARNLKEARR